MTLQWPLAGNSINPFSFPEYKAAYFPTRHQCQSLYRHLTAFRSMDLHALPRRTLIELAPEGSMWRLSCPYVGLGVKLLEQVCLIRSKS